MGCGMSVPHFFVRQKLPFGGCTVVKDLTIFFVKKCLTYIPIYVNIYNVNNKYTF
jgi:hypothetical protein